MRMHFVGPVVSTIERFCCTYVHTCKMLSSGWHMERSREVVVLARFSVSVNSATSTGNNKGMN